MKKFFSFVIAVVVVVFTMNAVVNAAVEEERNNARAISNNAIAMAGDMKSPIFRVTCYNPDGSQTAANVKGITETLKSMANNGECYVVLLGGVGI